MYEVKIGQFSGPLDLLLQLIETKELEITKISLACVTEEYLAYVQKIEIIDAEELADFLVVAARLLYLKSRELLPYLVLDDEEEGVDLESQLRLYREFAAASKIIDKLSKRSEHGSVRVALPSDVNVGFVAPVGLTLSKMREIYAGIIVMLEPLTRLPEKVLEKVISLKERILSFQELIKTNQKFSFHEVLASAESRGDIVVSFMALLELLKQQEVAIDQDNVFAEIVVRKIFR